MHKTLFFLVCSTQVAVSAVVVMRTWQAIKFGVLKEFVLLARKQSKLCVCVCVCAPYTVCTAPNAVAN